MIPPLQAAALVLPILLVQDVVTIWAYRKTFDRWNLAVMIPAQFIGVCVAWLLAAHVSDAYVRIAVGAIAVAFALNYWFGRPPGETAARPAAASGMLWGGIAGVTSFLANAGSPALQVHLLRQRMPKEVFVGTLSILLAAGNVMRIVPYIALGQLTTQTFTTALMLLPLAVATNVLGVWLVRRTSPTRFYRIVYVLILLVGLELVRNGLVTLLAS